MNRIISILFFLAVCVMGMSQDAEYRLIRQRFTINNDGTMDINYRKEIKLLRNRAITAYADKGETFILYNPAIDELTINESYTIRKDGSRVAVPINGMIDQLPSSCANCGRYAGLIERVVVHTALEYDCIIVLDYTIHRRSNVLNETIQLNQDCPVKEYQILVQVPQNQKVSISIPNFENQYKIKQENNGYSIVAKNLKQTIIDSYLPSSERLYPTVHIKNDRVSEPYINNFEPLDEASNLVAELFSHDNIQYITNIRNYVVDYVYLNDVPLALVNYHVASAKETFLSNCGTRADKCALMAALLRTAGFKASATADYVRCTIQSDGVATDYILSPVSTDEVRSVQDSKPSKRNINVNQTLSWEGESIGGGYQRMSLPVESGAFRINPSLLTSVRKAPLQVSNGKERYHYSIPLSQSPVFHLVGNPVDIAYTKPGIGTIRIRIFETIQGVVEIDKELILDVEDEIVTEKQYKDFRQMMLDWTSYQDIVIKPKKVQ